MTKSFAVAVATIALAISGVAAAQDAAQNAPPMLQIQKGQILTSSGAEFVTAQSGQPLVTGQRVMVSENSAARIVYPDGCDKVLANPGVYVVEADCEPVAAVVASGAAPLTAGQRALIALPLLGGAGAAATLLSQLFGGNDSDSAEVVPPPPVSQ